MKNLLNICKGGLFVLGLFLATSLTFAQSDAIVGTWLTQDKDAQVEIYSCGDNFCGKVVWLKEPKDDKGNDRTDVNNPEKSQRSRTIKGAEIMNGFSYDKKAKEWAGGTIYDSKSGKTYEGFMKMQKDGTLYMKGFVMGIRFLGRSNTWTRVE